MKSLTRSLLVVLAASILGCSAQKEPDAMLEAVLTEFSARDEINEFGKDDLILLSSRTQIWTKEQLRGMGTDPKSTCQIPEDLYDSLAKVTQTLPTAHLMRTNTNWRMATDEQQKKHDAMSNEQIDGRYVKSLVSVSAPGVSTNEREALVMVSFSWGMHGGLARYRLLKDSQGWRVHCSQLNLYV